MRDELSRLHELVAGLARRERALLLGQTALRAAALGALGLSVAALAVWRDVPRPLAIAWLVLVVGAGAWFLVAAPWLQRWRRAGDPLRQARLVEARDPELRGRLVTAIGRTAPRGNESPELLALVARRALERAARQDPRLVHPAAPLRRWTGLAVAAWVVAAVGLLGAPGGGTGVARWWLGGVDARAAALAGGAVGVGPSARVGDLTLRYVYPAYTGLEPYVVVNSTGEAHAPPGTRVEVVARTGEAVEAASLVAYDEPALDAVVKDGRTLSASFVVQARNGAYELVTHVGGETKRSRRFPIVADADLPPEVTVDVPERTLEVPVDATLDLRWTATDDYGIARVAIEVDHKEVGGSLKVPAARVATLEDVTHRRPIDLGMQAGRTYELVVVAWDNDTVSGSKAGRSAVLKIVVVGEDGVGRLDDALRAELLDVMVDVLGGSLEAPFPPGRLAGDYARWGERVNDRYEPLADFLDAHRGRRSTDPIWPPVDAAMADALTLVRFTQVSFLPGSTERANDGSAQSVAAFRTTAIESLEAAVLHVDHLLRNAALEMFTRESGVLAGTARDVEAALARSDADPVRLAMEAERVGTYLERLAGKADQLPSGGLQDFVQARLDEARSVLDEAKAAMRARDVADARKLMGRVSARLGEMASGLEEQLARMREEAEEKKGRGEDVVKLLKELRDKQDSLAAKVTGIDEQGGGAYRQQIAELWKRVEQQAAVVEKQVTAYDQGLSAAGGAFNERSFVGEAIERAGLAREGALARDPIGVERQAIELQLLWDRYAERAARLRAVGVPGPPTAELGRVRDDVDLLLALVRQLSQRAAAGDPVLKRQVQALETEQQRLRAALDDARDKARTAAQEMPVTPRRLDPALGDADARMGDALDQIARGEAMPAAGSQRAVSRHLTEAIEALEQAMQQAQSQAQELDKQQGGGGKGKPEKEPAAGEASKDDEEQREEERIALPEPEEFRTPEAYREALLQGMEGDVPEEYRALKRRYYEELVHQ